MRARPRYKEMYLETKARLGEWENAPDLRASTIENTEKLMKMPFTLVFGKNRWTMQEQGDNYVITHIPLEKTKKKL